MKIVKRGVVRKDIDYIYNGTCARCGCEVKCKREEVEIIDDIREQTTYYSVDCPEKGCGGKIWLKSIV